MNSERNGYLRLGAVLIGLVLIVGAVLFVLGLISEAGSVAQKEFGAKAALEKYEWFINQSNAIQKADKDIALFEGRKADVETQYTTTYGEDKKKWLPSTQTQYNQALSTARDDLLAIVSNRNGLVKEYNAQSEKFNWAPFQTRADMPPRSYFDYVVK